MARGHKVCLLKRLVVGSIPTRGNEIFILISSIWCRVWCCVPPLNTQCLQNSVESSFAYSAVCGIQRDADLFICYNFMRELSGEILSGCNVVIVNTKCVFARCHAHRNVIRSDVK